MCEGLTNLFKHSHPTRAEVKASVNDGLLQVEVCDDGTGGADPSGHGLVGMADCRHSADAVDGKDRDDLAEEIASDALFAVINKLDSYRGETRFTTWAYAFVINALSARLAHQTCPPRPLTMEDQGLGAAAG